MAIAISCTDGVRSVGDNVVVRIDDRNYARVARAARRAWGESLVWAKSGLAILG
jgi:hypothetical protein